MLNYKKLYHLLFNAVTDAIRYLNIDEYKLAKERLIKAQQDAEEEYIEADE